MARRRFPVTQPSAGAYPNLPGGGVSPQMGGSIPNLPTSTYGGGTGGYAPQQQQLPQQMPQQQSLYGHPYPGGALDTGGTSLQQLGGGMDTQSVLAQYAPQIKEQIMMQAFQDPKNLDTYAGLIDLLDQYTGTGAGSIEDNMSLFKAFQPTAGQEKDYVNAISGLSAINQMNAILFDESGGFTPGGEKARKMWNYGKIGLMLGGEETKQYAQVAKTAYDIVTRSRTGAALNMDEQSFYQSFIPDITDSPTSAQSKLRNLQQLYEMVAQAGEQPYDILLGGEQAVMQRALTPSPLQQVQQPSPMYNAQPSTGGGPAGGIGGTGRPSLESLGSQYGL